MSANTTTKHHDPALKLSERERRIYDFLQAHPVGVLSTVDPNRNPHGVVIYFSVNERLVVQFLTKTGTRKYDNLMHNPHAMLTVFSPATQTTVQITAKAKEVQENDLVNVVADSIFGASARASVRGLPPIVKLDAGEYTAFTLEPIQIRMATYIHHEPGGYAEIFESVESFSLRD